MHVIEMHLYCKTDLFQFLHFVYSEFFFFFASNLITDPFIDSTGCLNWFVLQLLK